jgi:hypothetical protein
MKVNYQTILQIKDYPGDAIFSHFGSPDAKLIYLEEVA